MSDVEYSIAAILKTQGDAEVKSKFGSVAQSADRTSASFSGIAKAAAGSLATVGHHIDAAVTRVVRLGTSIATMGAGAAVAGGLAAIKIGLTGVNAKLEQATLGFGVLFQKMGGMTFSQGLDTAKTLIEGIRTDAKSLPGEFGDFVAMAQTLTAPMLNLGKSAKDIRSFTRDAVVSAAALGINFDQAAREAAMLLEGHAGGHNVFGTRLGITARTQVGGKDWGQADQLKRYEYVLAKLKTNDEVLKANQNSWAGLTSTIVDSGKRFLGLATQPLFERAKKSMEGLLGLTDKNQDKLDQIASVVGVKLAHAYDWLEAKVRWIGAHWETIETKARSAAHAVEEGFKKAWPWVEKIGRVLKHEIEHPTTALRHLAELKMGGKVLEQAPNIANIATNVAPSAAPGVAPAVAPALGGILSGAGAAVFAAVAAAVASVGTAIVDNFMGARDAIVSMWTDIKASVGGIIGPIIEKGGALRDIFGSLGRVLIGIGQWYVYPLIFAFKGLGFALELLNYAWKGAKAAAAWFYEFLDVGLGGALTGVVNVGKSMIAWLVDLKNKILGLPGIGKLLGIKEPTEADKAAASGGYANIGQFNGAPKYANPEEVNKHGTGLSFGNPFADLEKGKVAPVNNIDMRGASITLKVDVKDSDPDRIVRRTFDALGRYVARPVTGGAYHAAAGA